MMLRYRCPPKRVAQENPRREAGGKYPISRPFSPGADSGALFALVIELEKLLSSSYALKNKDHLFAQVFWTCLCLFFEAISHHILGTKKVERA